MNRTEILLRLAGVLQFGVLFASALVPRVLDWPGQLARLSPFLRRLFWVYGVFIVLTITGFGTLTMRHAGAMAAGEPLGRSLAAFIALFWLVRLAVQLFVFDAREYLTNWFLTTGYHGLTVVFLYLVAVYGWVASGGTF